MAHNDNPDGGYDHFHGSGKKSPHAGKLVDSVGDRKARPQGSMDQAPSGKTPIMKDMGMQRNVPGSGGAM